MIDVIDAFDRGLCAAMAYNVRQLDTTVQAALGN